MYATIISILIALFLYFGHVQPDGLPLIFIAALFLVLSILAYMFAWLPLQKAEKNMTPRIVQAFQKDSTIRYGFVGMAIFFLLTVLIALFRKTELIALWIVLLGLAIDLFFFLMQRIMGYINPFSVINHFRDEALKSIREEDEQGLCQWIDALSEVAAKATYRSSTSLANQAVSKMPEIADTYFESAKSIGYQKLDKALYTLYYILQRLGLVYRKALEHHLEPECRHLINTASKIAVSSAKYDIPTADHPIRFIGDAALDAQKEGFAEIGDYASCALLEVARKILSEVDVTYLEIRDTFFTLINQLEAIAKETFRRDKNINLQILNQPFAALKELFVTEKMMKHQDTPLIVQDINRIMGEFDALGMVMRTIPPILKEEPKKEEGPGDAPQPG